MANTNAAYGFRPAYLLGGFSGSNPINAAAPQGYSIASAYGTSIYSGDPVKLSGTADAKGRPGIVIGTNGPNRGVFAGVRYTNAQGERITSPYWPASTVATDIEVMVYDHPHQVFSVQASAAIAATDIGQKADFVSGSGSAVSGQSGYQLDSTTIAAQDALLILGLDGTLVVNDFGTYAKALVLFREHELGATLTAV